MKRNNTLYIAPAVKVTAVATEPLLDVSINSDGEPIGQDPTPGSGDDQAANRGLFDGQLPRPRTYNVWE